MFSGLVCVGMFTAFGRFCTTVFVITGIVIRKMINNTNITSTNGVVLMVEFSSASSPSAGPTFIAIFGFLWNFDQGLTGVMVTRVLLANRCRRLRHGARGTTGRHGIAAATDASAGDEVRMEVGGEIPQPILHT